MSKALWSSLLVGLALLIIATSFLPYARHHDLDLGGQVRAASAAGLAFLAKSQLETGELPTYAWRMGEETKASYVRTPFTVSQILHALAFVDGGEVGRHLRERAIAFLVAHREAPGLWRYYGSDDGYYAQVYAQFSHPKLPPDVDDTAQAWAALSEHGIAVTPEALEILKANRTTAGLFNTWIGTPKELRWMDGKEREVDAVVNLNGLFLFARAGQPLPEVCRYAVTVTRTKAFHRGTVWYPSPLAYTYVLSRAYADGRAVCLNEAISEIRSYVLAHQQPDGRWGNDLETALGILTLLNTGERGEGLHRGVRALLAHQGSDGGWDLAPLYKGAVLYYGSRQLTTGFCLEALGKYLVQ